MAIIWRQSSWTILILMSLMVACVTINVYFPAAAVEKAADKIIEDVWGTQPESSEQKSGGLPRHQPSIGLSQRLLNVLIQPANAQANVNVSTPAIEQSKAAMTKRFRQLEPLFNSGAVGLSKDGGVTVRDQNAVPLQDRNQVKGLVQQENSDRAALYREIAKANGHSEWEADIRATFAQRWIKNARAGWWYQNAKGQWLRK